MGRYLGGMITKDTIKSGAMWQAVDALCDTSTLLLLECLWLQETRFVAFQAKTGLNKMLISSRIKQMTEIGLLERRQYTNSPPRYEYILSPMGLDTFPIAMAMLAWEMKWGHPPPSLTVSILHKTCGQTLSPILQCGSCNLPAEYDTVVASRGPSFTMGQDDYTKRRRQGGLKRSNDHTPHLFEDISILLGDRWLTLLIRAALLGHDRFDDFLRSTKMATNILSDRLALAVQHGLFDRYTGDDGHAHPRYILTEKATDMFPIVAFMLDWGERWFANDAGPHVMLTHTSCGKPLLAETCCKACGEKLMLETVKLQAG
ncbi:transcriptional regulator [Kordiimonas sediminis]|uniref:Transcriptional regulator n=1 Tax=Kordiimonas sediminis TaxID=1735581 RepID=A0A919APN9_9PROT|nr:helix-turn-helix domain-containing protein [Kordiimonas sediminis]GHF19370.1 transcriptional regulator [Kordiimonas sediminis]